MKDQIRPLQKDHKAKENGIDSERLAVSALVDAEWTIHVIGIYTGL
jgi:hypothetical protein